jgi:hypothetical protein
MTKQAFLAKLQALYSLGNRSDSDNREPWTHPDMAGPALCAKLDEALHAMVALGVITPVDLQLFHDTMY